MSAAEVPSWSVLVSLMVHGPDVEPTVRGTIRSVDGTDESRHHIGFTRYEDDPDPIIAGTRIRAEDADGAFLLRVWKDGSRVRIEAADGTPNLIVGETARWSFDPGHEEPLESSRAEVLYGYRGTGLLGRREARGFLGNDFTRLTGPIGSTVFLGRQAWTLELAPPQSKPYPLQLVVDAETGLLLQQRNDGFGTVDEWTEFIVGEELDPGLFVWTGPVRSEAEAMAMRDAEHEADMARRQAWVSANVAAGPLRLEIDVSIHVHDWDDATGAFEASLGDGRIGTLARRPTSDEPWDRHARENQHRWSDAHWDWALVSDVELAPGAIEALKRQLSVGL